MNLQIAAHRGVSGGDIPCNTRTAFEIALMQGADIVELDVAVSKEGSLFVFHPGMEPAHLLSEKLIRDMTDEEVRRLRFHNIDNVITEEPVLTLDEALEQLKNRCLINVDKFWTAVGPIAETIRRHGMADQVIVKTSPDKVCYDTVEALAPDMPYMIVTRNTDECTAYLKTRPLRYIGTEVLFREDSSVLASREYIDDMDRQGFKVWVNAIVYNYKTVISGGHTDDAALRGDPAWGWKWLYDRGFDIIQTDWPQMLRQYLTQNT